MGVPAHRHPRQAADAAARTEGLTVQAAVHVRLTDDIEIREINREQRKIDAATDVLSFPTVFYAYSGEVLDKNSEGPYKLALKDMCMYRAIPQLIQAGVFSFKIEGRMRPAPFIRRIVSTYRKAIDAYIADPQGYTPDEEGWRSLHENRARDFTTTFAFGGTTKQDIGFTGEREPRFFSNAVKEAGFQDEVLLQEKAIEAENTSPRHLSVRVGTPAAAKAAIDNGANCVYIGGEAFRPNRPWKLKDYEEIIAYAHVHQAKAVIETARTTRRRECGELEQFFTALKCLPQQPDGIMVSNLGSLQLDQKLTDYPLYADHSFNLFNHLAAKFMKENGITDNRRVGLYGLTYKENVDDCRESPTLQLLEAQERHLARPLKVYDPFIKKDIVQNQFHDLDEFLNDVDLVVIMVKHDEIKNQQEKLKNKVVLDCCNIIRNEGVYHI